MKKLISAILIIFVGCFLISCDTPVSKAAKAEAKAIAQKNRVAAAEAYKKISENQEKEARAKRAAAKIETEKRRIANNWQLKYFVDDFGDKTKSKYISASAIGTFSNSATRNSYLYVRVFVTASGSVGIFLQQYNDRQPSQRFTNGTVMMKSGKYKMTAAVLGKWNQSGGISVDSNVINMLKKSKGIVKFVIHDEYSSEWKFEISADGFCAALKSSN